MGEWHSQAPAARGCGRAVAGEAAGCDPRWWGDPLAAILREVGWLQLQPTVTYCAGGCPATTANPSGMCGRYTQTRPGEDVAQRFLLRFDPQALELRPRFNIAPSQFVLTVAAGPNGREPAFAKWGFLPAWAKHAKLAQINARSETAAGSGMFRAALRARRCLIPADGFFEWPPRADGAGKTPMRFTLRSGNLFAFAGIWEEWAGGPDGPLRTCAILTTHPNELVANVHNRMPVILRPEHEGLWLDPAVTDPAALAPAWAPYPADAMRAYPVSGRVNSPRFDDPECIGPVA